MPRPDLIPMLRTSGLRHYRVEEPYSGAKERKLRLHLFLTPPRRRVELAEPFGHDFWTLNHPSFQPGGINHAAPSPMVDSHNLIRSGIPQLAKQIRHATLEGQRVKERLDDHSDISVFPMPVTLSVQQRGFWPAYITLEANIGTAGERYIRAFVKRMAAQKISECTDGSKARGWFQKLPKPDV